MNCPNCGAENEVDARFCAECGTPLESADQPLDDENDQTIMSTVSQISEEAKTVSVTQEDVANLAAEMGNAEEAKFETDSPSSPPVTPTNADSGGADNTQRNIIIGVVVLLFLCCCCCALLSLIGYFFGDSIGIDTSLLRDVSPATMALI